MLDYSTELSRREQYCRSQDPVTYWENQKTNYPNLFHLSTQFSALHLHICAMRADFFSKAVEIVSKKPTGSQHWKKKK